MSFLNQIKSADGFVSAKPEKRVIDVEVDGEPATIDVYVKKLAFASATKQLQIGKDSIKAIASRIASSLCDENGNPVLTAEDITGESDPDRGSLSEEMTYKLLAVISEVNGLGKPQVSKNRKKSGTS